MKAAAEALNRMILLVYDYVSAEVEESTIVDAFQNCVVRCVASREAISTRSGQDALITFVSLVTRMGVQVELAVADVPIRGNQPPLIGPLLIPALVDLGRNTIPGTTVVEASCAQADLTFVWGNVRPTKGEYWSVGATDSVGAIRFAAVSPLPVLNTTLPFGPLASAALAAGEVFKHVVRRLPLADSYSERYLRRAADAQFDFGFSTHDRAMNFGDITVISAGAISQAVLFTLYRLPNVRARFHVVDSNVTELSNLNRNVLSTVDDVDSPKVEVVRKRAPVGVDVNAIPHRFPSIECGTLPLQKVVVGVDDIPSRWATQRLKPGWLGVAGTTHFQVSCSSHRDGEPCAGCLHPRDDVTAGPIPTVSFVSFWAGRSLAARLVREAAGRPYAKPQQHLWLSPLRMDAGGPIWWPVAARRDCPAGCEASSNVALSA
jgi:hypothetical protein